MDKYQIMALMMRSEHQVIDANFYGLSAVMADKLAAVSDKLSDAELDSFIRIGAAIYRAGMNEFGARVPVEDLFPANENWPDGPQPGRSGFRHRE